LRPDEDSRTPQFFKSSIPPKYICIQDIALNLSCIAFQMEIRKIKDKKDKKAIEFIARENTWSNQRRKQREGKRNSDQACQQPEFKRAKIDGCPLELQKDQNFCLKGLLLLEETNTESITLQMYWIEGGSGRESINQILQYMKNHLFEK
jgi:hypothetical protein